MTHDSRTTRPVRPIADPSRPWSPASRGSSQRVAGGHAPGVDRRAATAERLLLSEEQAHVHAAAAAVLPGSQVVQEAHLSRHDRTAGGERSTAGGARSGPGAGAHD